MGIRGGAARELQALFDSGAVGTLGDAELLARFVRREGPAEAAFKALVDRHARLVSRVCLDVLGDSHEAQDAAQATFFILARQAASIRNPDSLASWLHGTARRVATRALRETLRRRDLERRLARWNQTNPTVPDPSPGSIELHEELARLPGRYRDPIVLCDLTGLNHEQAAGQLGCPVRTLQTRLYRGRERLKGRLIRRGVAPSSAVLGLAGTTTARATLPAGWVGSTAKAAWLVAKPAGWAAAGEGSVVAVGWAKGTLQEMTMFQWKWIAFASVLVGAVAGGAWTIAPGREQASAREPRPQVAAQASTPPKDAFELTYVLADGEDIKIFHDVAIEARIAHFREQDMTRRIGEPPNPLGRRNSQTTFFGWNDGAAKWTCTMASAALLSDVLGYALNVRRQEIAGDAAFLKLLIPADVLIRDRAPIERLVPQLETILRRDYHLPIRISAKIETRDVIVVRGRYKFQPDPGRAPRTAEFSASDQIEVYAREIAAPSTFPFSTSGSTFAAFLSDLAMFDGRRFVDETENSPQALDWRVSGYQFYQQIPIADRAPTLANVARQTGLNFVEESRKVRVIRVDREE